MITAAKAREILETRLNEDDLAQINSSIMEACGHGKNFCRFTSPTFVSRWAYGDDSTPYQEALKSELRKLGYTVDHRDTTGMFTDTFLVISW